VRTEDQVAVQVRIDGRPAKGNDTAQLVLLEFIDYQCPFCARHFRETFAEIERTYIEKGMLRYIALHFPLEQIHPNAFRAAEAALCAGNQGKYWQMHARLFLNQHSLRAEDLALHAEAVGVDRAAFDGCMDRGEKRSAVRLDLNEGQQAGVQGTPTFVLGLVEQDGKSIRISRVMRGVQTFAAFKIEIEKVLAARK
jgi:protein-disulfide isomerase